MFTGIVEELGTVASRDGARLRINAETVVADIAMGESIAVNGCCLTVVGWGTDDGRSWWEADVVDETYARTSLGELVPGAPVNLERPVRLQDRLGGHLVQGHVDGVGTVRTTEPEGDGRRLTIDVDESLLRYCVEKGSITVEGVSLTVASLDERGFSLALIPHTLAVTTLGSLAPGDQVNLEVDVLAKYVERLLAR